MKRSTALGGRHLQRAFFTSPVDHRAHPNVATPTRAARKRIVRAISTLDPQRICITDAIDFSSLTYPRVRLPSGQSFIQYQYHSSNRHEKPLPFPDQTVGFLYFHTPSCSIRFRVVPSRLPVDFNAGHDLRSHDGTVIWGIRTGSLARGRLTEAFRQQLLDEGMIDLPALQLKARTITTLHHEEVSDRDLLDVSGCSREVRVWLARPNGTTVRLFACYEYSKSGAQLPSGTRGFLYYHAPSNPYDGAIRLRLAERAAEFDDGSDLHHPVLKNTWEIALERIATHRDTAEIQHEELLDYLVQKKLAPEEVVRHMRMTRSVAQLHDVFFVNFRATSPMIELRGHDGARAHLLFGYPFRPTGSQIAAYEGAALAHLDIVATTDTKIQVGLRIHTLLHGPHKLPEEAANGYPVFLLSEGARVPRYTTGGPASTRVKKDSAAGRILLQMMEQEGGDKRARTE
ncbi:hypothetical protein EV121DRAFT_217006 [Schizophyllum commune]